MKSKVETPEPKAPKKDFPFKFFGTNVPMPTSEQLHQFGWNTINFSTVAAATSASIISVQSPIKTMLLSLTKNGTFIPAIPMAASGGVFGIFRAFYQGTMASASSSVARTGYVTGVKGNKPVDEVTDGQFKGVKKKQLSLQTLGYISSAAFGDILITNGPDTLSQLKKVPDLLPKDFKWRTFHNSYKLMASGFVPRYLSGMVNFASLCLIEDEIASRLPFKDKNATHFAAGALSGMTAAVLSYPFAVFKDYTLVRSTVNNGKLINVSSIAVMKELTHTVMSNPKEAFKSFFKLAAKQMPLRAGLTAAIFSIVAGVGEVLGTEPLKSVVPEKYQPPKPNSAGFFSGSKPAPKAAEVVDKTDEMSSTRKAT